MYTFIWAYHLLEKKSDSVGKEEGGSSTRRPCGGPATILSMIYFSVISSLWRLMWLLPIRWLCFSFFLIPVGEIVDSSSWFFKCCEYFSLGMLRYFFLAHRRKSFHEEQSNIWGQRNLPNQEMAWGYYGWWKSKLMTNWLSDLYAKWSVLKERVRVLWSNSEKCQMSQTLFFQNVRMV